MSIVKPTIPVAEIDLPQAPAVEYGGGFKADRIFEAGAVQVPAKPEEVETPTPEQEAAYDELMRIVGDSPERAAHALELIKQVDAAKGCSELNKKCQRHENDHGDLIHRGPEFSITVGAQEGLLPFHLVKWGDDRPYIVYGWDADELNVAAVDKAIEAEQKHLAALIETRAHLAAALGEAGSVYVPPTLGEDAEEIRTVGASGAILLAALYTPTDENGADKPQVLAVYSDTAGTTTDELDRAGALDLKAQLLAFLPKLDAMIDALPAEVAVEPPKGEKAQQAGIELGGRA